MFRILKQFLAAAGIAIIAGSTGFALAHGGVAQLAGNTIVTLNQQPISPLVGEAVTMNFIFTDKNFKQLPNVPLKLTVIDTFFNDASKDQTILTKQLQTDNNGLATFQYSFNKENYFDVHLDFTDPATKQPEQVGFLVQPRSISGVAGISTSLFWRYAAALALGLAFGFIFARIFAKSKNSPKV